MFSTKETQKLLLFDIVCTFFFFARLHSCTNRNVQNFFLYPENSFINMKHENDNI